VSGPTQRDILEAVRRGRHVVRWSTIRSEHDGHIAEFTVTGDALMLDGVRVAVTADTQQRIADTLDASLLTTRLADLLWAQAAVRIAPQTSTAYDRMGDWSEIEAHSRRCDLAICGREGLAANVGKHWVLSDGTAGRFVQGLAMACNYGWHDETGRTIQSPGFRHNLAHTDYSQTCTLVARVCVVDGEARDLHRILTDRTLAPLASSTGAMRVLRQPGVS
jgi:hypothetical protein